jgi:hypothetical protein
LVGACIALAVILALLGPGLGPIAGPSLQWARAFVAAIVGESRVAPVPLGEEAEAGPLRIKILEVKRDQVATDAVLAANPVNDPPRQGVTYLAIMLAVRNVGDRPIFVAGTDFALTGQSGIVRRFIGAAPPAPAIDAVLLPGESREGWIVLAAPVEEQQLLLLFDSLSLDGVWADRVIALGLDTTIADAPASLAAANEVGRDPAAPAGLSTPIITNDWQIEILEVVSGAAVFDLVDYRTGALEITDATGEKDQSYWLALRVRVTNVQAGGAVAYLPSNAFVLVDESGDPLLDIATLTPPRPDASGDYYPGASRDGWVAFDVPLDYTAAIVRFLPYPTIAPNPDPRYLRYE